MRSPRSSAPTMASNITFTTSSALPLGNFKDSDSCSMSSLLVTGMRRPPLHIHRNPEPQRKQGSDVSQCARGLILAEDRPHRVGDLSDGGHRFDGGEDGR